MLESRLFPPVCLGVAFLVRVGWILLVDPKPVSDFYTYFTSGLEISLGHGYHEGGLPTALWPVGYPAFLGGIFAIFGRSLFVAKLANVFLYVGIIALSYRLAARLFRSSLTPRLTLLLLSFYPNHIAYASLVACETLFVFLLMLGALLFLSANSRYPMLVLSGVVLGLASLVRPQALLAPILFVLLAPGSKQAGRRAGSRLLSLAIVYVGVTLAVLPWTLRNYRAFGRLVVVSTNGGGMLLLGNNPWADGTYAPRPELHRIMNGRSEPERDDQGRKFALSYMREHPIETVMRWPRKLWYLYRGDVEGIRWNVEGIHARGASVPEERLLTALLISEAYYLLVAAACLASLFFFWKGSLGSGGGQATFTALGLGVIAYFSLLGMVYFGDPRYHFPAMPWVVMYAAALPEAIESAWGARKVPSAHISAARGSR